MRALGKSLGSATLQILWGSLCLLQGRWLLRINTALLQRTTPLARFFHSIVYSFIQLFLEHLLCARYLGSCQGYDRDPALKDRDIHETEWDSCPALTAQRRGLCRPGSQDSLPGEGDI